MSDGSLPVAEMCLMFYANPAFLLGKPAMPVTCPKCAYVRKPADTQPEWQCPACGVAYAKAGGLPEVMVQEPTAPGKSVLARFKPLIFVAVAMAAVAMFRDRMPDWAGGPMAEPPPGPAAVELSAEEVRAMVGEGGDAEAFLGQHSDNPALENHFYKVEGSDGPSLTYRPFLTREADAQLKQITPERVVLFGARSCTYCHQVKRYLKQKQVAFADLDVQNDARAAHYESSVLQTTAYPVLVIDREVMFGYNLQELARAVRSL